MSSIQEFKFFNLALTLSFSCPNNCRHCGIVDVEEDVEEMGVEEAKHYIDMTSQLKDIMSIVITVGEPLLAFNKVISILEYAKTNYDYQGSISTSAYGMDTFSKTKSLLTQLQKAGLGTILLSVDDFHQEYVPIENVEYCLKAAQELEIPVMIQTMVTKDSGNFKDFKNILNFNESDNITFLETPCDPIGRAERQISDEKLLTNKQLPQGGCSIFRVIQIYPDGSVKLCCGTGSVHDNLTFGNVNEQHLYDIVKKAETQPLPNALAAWRGPGYLMKLAKEGGYSEYLLDSYTSVCHACYHIISNPELYSFLTDRLVEKTQELVGARLYLEKKYNYFQPPSRL